MDGWMSRWVEPVLVVVVVVVEVVVVVIIIINLITTVHGGKTVAKPTEFFCSSFVV